MIRSFRSKALREFIETGSPRRQRRHDLWQAERELEGEIAAMPTLAAGE